MKRLLLAFLLIVPAALAQTNAVPFLSQLYPLSTTPGRPAFTLKVTGAGFASTATVNWNGSARPTTFINPDYLQAAITAADIAHANTANITVVNPAPGGGTSNVAYFPVGPRTTSVAFARRDTPLLGGRALAVGDFNHDGKLDVVITGGEVQTFLGNGDGTFQPPIISNFLSGGDAIVVGDIDGDGNLDLITGDSYLPGVFLLRGNGDGTFSQPWPDFDSFVAVAIGDVNGDGKLDLITSGSHEEAAGAGVFLGNGDGTFTVSQSITLESGGEAALGDFNRDGKLDLALTDYHQQTGPAVDALLGDGNGTFGGGSAYQCTYGCHYVTLDDTNGDGKLDLVDDGFSVLLGNGNGSFTGEGGTPLYVYGGSLNLADFNHDNRLDASVAEFGPYTQQHFSILLGNGDGTFQGPMTWASGQSNSGTGVGDFNGDGRLDIVTLGRDEITGASVLSVFLQTALNISPTYLNFGAVKVGTQSAPQTVTLTNIGNSTVSVRPIQVFGDIADFNGYSNCSNLGPGASCTMTGTFNPKSKGRLVASVEMKYSGTLGSPQFIEIEGTGD
jgi:hypothetical protein